MKIVLLVAMILLIIGCSRSSPASQAGVDSRASGRTAPAAIGEVIVGSRSKDGRTSNFGPITATDEILISVRPAESTGGSKISVKLINLSNGEIEGEKKVTVQAAESTPAEFSFKKATPWDGGRYLIEVTLDGKLAWHRDLDVIERPPSVVPAEH
ncbi:MAG: hypothetical protein NVV67_15830 [Pseudoxanthomonas sp.]|nr:hypothetical protein [Pseudoxanthomonas sp.]